MKKVAKKLLSLVVVVCIAFMGVFAVPTFGAKAAEIAFTLGTDGTASHVDGTTTGTTYTETVSGYTLTLTSCANVYKSARDAKGNGCLKLGTSSKVGSFSFTVPNDVTGVIIAVAQYKTNATNVTVNGTNHTITTASDKGAYTDIEVDTTTTKTVSLTVPSKRAMINTITYVIEETGAPKVTVIGEPTMFVGANATFTAELTNCEGTPVWTSSNTDVATVENGVVTAKAMGTTTITAELNGTEDSQNVTVWPSNEKEITIAEALAVCDLTGSANAPYTYTTTGVIESIDTAYDSEHNNITVTIGDGTNSILVYRLKEGSDLAVGTKISVTGTLVTYSGTCEFTSGATYVIVEDDDATETIKEALNQVQAYMSLSYGYTQTTKTVAASSEVVDTLTLATTGVSGTSYTDWSGKTATSSAVYAGQSAGGNSSIQLRSDTAKGYSGVVTTTSGGFAKKITVAWNSNTSSERTLNVYGSNTAYTAAADLYGTNSGTLLGTIVNGTSTELEIEGEYEYIGIRSASSAMYLTSVEITWEVEGDGEGTVEKTVYENSDFRIRFGVDASLTEIANVESYGIRVTAGDKTVDYTTTNVSWSVDETKGMVYVVVDLGDIINAMASLGTEFTVQAYVVAGDFTYVSTATKTYSVASMIKAYYEANIAEVEHLYNYLNENGLYA